MESFRRISPKDKKYLRKIAEYLRRIRNYLRKIAEYLRRINQKTNAGNPMTKIWKLGCGDEVKGEGYILNLILYSFFRVFPIFDPRVPFHFSLAARIYKKEFSNLHPSPFYLTFYVSNSYG